MNGVKIERLNPADPWDRRGLTTEWKFENGSQITVFERKKGIKFGGHYHAGGDPSKNPEKFYLVKGRVRAKFLVLETLRVCGKSAVLVPKDKDKVGEEYILTAGNTLTIWPYVYHEMEALEDCIFIEYRVTHFNREKPDTYPVQ
ncbi:MAG: hypothetical protein UV01_C0001G0005 [Parcubacteria group bacterium GW2011_GWA2_42_14]|nr:MAG: hypothetical protein UV01_C0001G0005 [Parcubacteria group bacterium GW2011_GWA2_42_14]